MKKTIIALSMCLAMVLALGGCAKKDSGTQNTAPSASPSATPSDGMGNEGDYRANDNGAVDGNGSVPGTTPAGDEDRTGSARSNTSTGGAGATGDGVLDDVGSAVDDLVNDAKHAVRDAT